MVELKLKPNKCHLFRKNVDFLGHMVSENGMVMQDRGSPLCGIGLDKDHFTKSGFAWACAGSTGNSILIVRVHCRSLVLIVRKGVHFQWGIYKKRFSY